ncbi:MAG: hypothetical protein M1821_006400 [Bathelium mastoideum]|nr:MAG: hypothetical protein M1821_006400 [Bathelium mastoideum]KAI9693678.1 MAG: hypothetical protein M1822_002949 [Bathelium mastoideum]
MSGRDQDSLRVYPPAQLLRSIPLSLEDAQIHIADYLDRADLRENTHLHPDAQITPSGINGSSQGGSAGGLILSHLRRVQKGLNGERIEIDPKLLDTDWEEEDTEEKPSEDSRLDALIAKGGYNGGTSADAEDAQNHKGKKGKRKREEMETQADSVTLLNPTEQQNQASQSSVHGKPDDTEGWQTMESYQREMEDEGEDVGDLERRHNFRQQTEPEPEVKITGMQVEEGAENELDREVQKDLEAGKEKVKKKKRKRTEEDEQKEENAEKNGVGEGERQAKKAKADSAEWSFEGLKNKSHGTEGGNDLVKKASPDKTTESKTPKKEKKEKNKSEQPHSTITTTGRAETNGVSSSMPPPKAKEPKKPQSSTATTPSTKSKDVQPSTKEKQPTPQKKAKAAGLDPSKMTDLMRQSLQRKSPIPPKSDTGSTPKANGQAKSESKSKLSHVASAATNGNTGALSPDKAPKASSPNADTQHQAPAAPMSDPAQAKKKKRRKEQNEVDQKDGPAVDEVPAEAQANGTSHLPSGADSSAKTMPSSGDAEGQGTIVGDKTAAEKEARKKAKKERDKQYRKEKEKAKLEKPEE